jgi:phosphomannomutase/phosphoglucomutase
MSLSQSIFKAYDIRGIVADELTPDVVKLIGQAIGSESIAKGERGVVIGRDGRLSGVELMSALKEGLKSTGCHVVDIGMVPTPLVYYATYSKAATSGVMITGSHVHQGVTVAQPMVAVVQAYWQNILTIIRCSISPYKMAWQLVIW